jgi:hypothetical protein
MTVRAKFKVDYVTKFASGSQIQMSPVTCGSAENEKFYNYTPGGSMSLTTINDEAAKMFVPGKEYYIDITPAEVINSGVDGPNEV